MDNNLQQIIDSANATQTIIDGLQAQVAAEGSTVVYENLEYTPWLLAPGALADSDTASGNVPIAIQKQPLVECASFGINPQGKSYANAYWFVHRPGDASKTTFKYEVSFLFPAQSDSNACQALELDLQQVISQKVFNFGFQFDFADGFFRVWNRNAHQLQQQPQWVSTGIPMPRWSPLQWHRIEVGAHRDDSKVYYDYLILDGVKTNFTISFPAPVIALSDMLNNAIQLDGAGSGTAYRVMVDSVRLTVS